MFLTMDHSASTLDDFDACYNYPLYNILSMYRKYSIINDRMYFMVEPYNRTQPFLVFYRKNEQDIVNSVFPLLEMDAFEAFIFLSEERKIKINIKNLDLLIDRTKYALVMSCRSGVTFREYIELVLNREVLKKHPDFNILVWTPNWLCYLFDRYEQFFLNVVVPIYAKKGIPMSVDRNKLKTLIEKKELSQKEGLDPYKKPKSKMFSGLNLDLDVTLKIKNK